MGVVSATLIPRQIRSKRIWNPSRSASKVTTRISTKKKKRPGKVSAIECGRGKCMAPIYASVCVYARVRFLSHLRYAIAE